MQYTNTIDYLTMDLGEALEQINAMRNKYLKMHNVPITQGQGKDRRWSTRVRDNSKPDGWRIIRKPTREEVENEVIKYYKYLNDGENKDATVDDCFRKWLAYKQRNQNTSPETFRKYKNDYRRCIKGTKFSKMKIAEVDYADIETFLEDKITELSLKRTAVSNLAGYLRGMFKVAIRDKIIRSNPFDGVDLKNNVYPLCNRAEKPEEERILSVDDVDNLLDVLHTRHEEYPTYMPDWAIEICVWSGLRVGEVVAIKWDDIKDGALYITKSEHRIPHEGRPDEYIIGDTKTHKSRRIPVGKELQKVFDEIRLVQSEYGFENDYIIADKDGRITAPDVSNAMYRRGREAGAKACSIHAIRRTVSSRLNTQYDRATVAHIMGHTEQVNMLHYDYDTVRLEHQRDTMDNLYQIVSG